MIHKTQVVRRANRLDPNDPESELWPITMVLLILSGFAAGLVIALSDFQSGNLFENGYIRLFVLGTMSAGLLGAATWLNGRMLMRLQMAFLACLMAFLAFLLFSPAVFIPIYAKSPEPPSEEPKDELVTLPDYGRPVDQEESLDELLQSETDTPTPEVEQEEVEKEATKEEAEKKQPTDEPQPTEKPDLKQEELERTEVSKPLEATELAGETISRQEMDLPDDPTQEVEENPDRPQTEQAEVSPAEPTPTEIERQTAENTQFTKQTDDSAPTTDMQLERMELQREQSQDQVAELSPEQVRLNRQSAEQEVLQDPNAASPEEVESISDRTASSPDPARDLGNSANVGPVAKTNAAGPTTNRRPQESSGGNPSVTPSTISGTPSTASISRANSDRGAPVSPTPGPTGQVSRNSAATSGATGISEGEVADVSSTIPNRNPASGGSMIAKAGPTSQSAGVKRRGPATSGGSLTKATGDFTPGVRGPAQAGPTAPASGGRKQGDRSAGLKGSSLTGNSPRSGLPARKTGDLNLPSGEAELVEAGPTSNTPKRRQTGVGLPSAPKIASTKRRTGGGPKVKLDAPAGPGGLTRRRPSLEMGLPTRRPDRRSEVASLDIARFILEKSGGKSAANSMSSNETVPTFSLRQPEIREKIAKQFGGSEGSEQAVELGLAFLARQQAPQGNWWLHGGPPGGSQELSPDDKPKETPTAATGLALLAFLGAGYDHQTDKYRDVVKRGLDWLIANQGPNGDLYAGGSDARTRMYSHGIATIPLCEAYAMTRDPKLREPAQKAIRFILEAQDPTRGGWRYAPYNPNLREPRLSRQSDTSVSGWQMMALKSGDLAGLNVPRSAYAGVSRWLDFVQSKESPSQYIYLPIESQMSRPHELVPNNTMTAEALLMRMYLGWDRENPQLQKGADYLLANLPPRSMDNPNDRPNCYYWYYATQVMFQVQGDHWESWNNRLRDLLVNSQVRQGDLAGSWDPGNGDQGDVWGAYGGRIYVTSMHLLMLEVYYRHLPLFKLEEQKLQAVE